MKKFLSILFFFAVAQVAHPQSGMTVTTLCETVGGTNYLGLAKVSATKDASVNSNVWMILKTVYDASGNLVSSKTAIGSATGDASLWSTAWTNRANATYK